jgi:rubrerythrin
MTGITRRQFFRLTALFPIVSPMSAAVFAQEADAETDRRFPITTSVLKAAYRSEMLAHKHYLGYSQKAIGEKYPNIAYLFSAFAISEKIHAENYEKVLVKLRTKLEESKLEIIISDTRSNLRTAAKNELMKIKKIYPEFLKELGIESHDQAVINCMYAWKSHCQHEKKINEVRKYSKLFFGSVAKKIEGMNLDFHVCEICGSTIDAQPETPCDICNFPMYHYMKVPSPY